jgi:hypothetical protein
VTLDTDTESTMDHEARFMTWLTSPAGARMLEMVVCGVVVGLASAVLAAAV